MAIIGDRWPSETHKAGPATWESIDQQGINEIITKLAAANEISPSDKVLTQMNSATEALCFALNGQEVFSAVDPFDAEIFFAVGPRFVTEQNLPFILDEIVSEASCILMGAGLEYDLNDEKPSAAIRDGLLTSGLLEIGSDGDLFDSFSDERRFTGVITVALENWEMNLRNQPATQEEKEELMDGMTSEEVASLAEQFTNLSGSQFTLQTFLSDLTPASGMEIARRLGNRHAEPLAVFLDRLVALDRKYQG